MRRNDNGSVTLTREELYDQVWCMPMTLLAKEYGISDTGLAKICRRFRIPRPGRGYWAKRQHGKRVRKVPLPHPKEPETAPITIPRQGQDDLEEESEGGAVPVIVVSDVLVEPHPLIARTERSLRSVRLDEKGLVSPRAKRALRVSVAPESIDRAMRILDALVKAVEERGWAVKPEVTPGQSPRTVVTVDGERIQICITEKLQREEQEPEPKGNARPDSWTYSYKRYRYRPTGLLSLEILTEAGSWIRRKWSDGKRRQIPSHLGSVVATLPLLAEAIKSQRREQEEARKRREAWEQERAVKLRVIREEEERLSELDAEVDAWHRSQRLRAYVAAVESAAEVVSDPAIDHRELAHWIAWATAQAERLDPLVESPPSILDEKGKWGHSWCSDPPRRFAGAGGILNRLGSSRTGSQGDTANPSGVQPLPDSAK